MEFDSYFLDLPNQEVRLGLMKGLVSSYIVRDTRQSNKVLREMARCLSRNDMDGALCLLQTFLSTVPYTDNTDYEGHYQQVLYIIFSLLGYYVDVEVHFQPLGLLCGCRGAYTERTGRRSDAYRAYLIYNRGET